MKVLGVDGSGRGGGNTGVLVRAILDGAKAGGCETELFELAQWDIHGCRSCRACKETHKCVQKDDMKRFYDVAGAIDVLVLCSPIYLDHITAQLMAFIQRTYCYLGAKLENHYPNKNARAVLGITYGAGNPEAYRYVLDWMAGRLKGYFGIEALETFTVPSASITPNITADHPEIVRAMSFGRTLGDS